MFGIISKLVNLYDSILAFLATDMGKILLGTIFAFNTLIIIMLLMDYKNEKERT